LNDYSRLYMNLFLFFPHIFNKENDSLYDELVCWLNDSLAYPLQKLEVFLFHVNLFKFSVHIIRVCLSW